jgi:hypothetical protein
VYRDSNRISDIDQVCSTSGFVFAIEGGVVTWRTSK